MIIPHVSGQPLKRSAAVTLSTKLRTDEELSYVGSPLGSHDTGRSQWWTHPIRKCAIDTHPRATLAFVLRGRAPSSDCGDPRRGSDVGSAQREDANPLIQLDDIPWQGILAQECQNGSILGMLLTPPKVRADEAVALSSLLHHIATWQFPADGFGAVTGNPCCHNIEFPQTTHLR